MNKGGKGEGQGRRGGGELVNNGEVRDIMKELGRTALLEVKHYKNSMQSTLNVGTFFDRTQNSPRSPRGFLKCV
jgi:hypothetical protein